MGSSGSGGAGGVVGGLALGLGLRSNCPLRGPSFKLPVVVRSTSCPAMKARTTLRLFAAFIGKPEQGTEAETFPEAEIIVIIHNRKNEPKSRGKL